MYDSIFRKLKKQAKESRGRDASLSSKTKKPSQEVISMKVRTADTPGFGLRGLTWAAPVSIPVVLHHRPARFSVLALLSE